jgi:hypothetical protein
MTTATLAAHADLERLLRRQQVLARLRRTRRVIETGRVAWARLMVGYHAN